MTNSSDGFQELSELEIDLVSGGEDDKMTSDLKQAGRDFANAIEDTVEYVGGFFAGIGRAFTNGR